MTQEINLSVLPSQAIDDGFILRELKKKEELKNFNVKSYRIIRKSIDARRNPVKINLSFLVSDEERLPELEISHYNHTPVSKDANSVNIVGAGPAGLFAALRALELGMRPIVLERGYDVDTRRKDIAKISRDGKISSDSNFCFGEGGAGTFSDGKLYTRSKKRGNIREILEILHLYGASEDILINSHPHIGSDRLPAIIKNIRNKIIECKGEVRFGCYIENLIIDQKRVSGVITNTGEKIYGPVFLATGHSARDTYRMLDKAGVKLEPKGLAIGVRLEHPQNLIDQIQYHNSKGREKFLPAAEYSFVNQVDGRGVYTFCMCPGGVIVPAVSDHGQIVVNGMSASARSGKWSNSGFVVELHPGDLKGYESSGKFEMMDIQEMLEKKFSEESKGTLNAPAQRISDFISGSVSKTLPPTSYIPGIHSSDFSILFPQEISERLKEGLKAIGRKCPKFIGEEGIMIGLESRTSSPLRIPRDAETLCHVDWIDLYPMGEGAGYAGGIVSSAIDGRRCIDAYYKNSVKNGGHN